MRTDTLAHVPAAGGDARTEVGDSGSELRVSTEPSPVDVLNDLPPALWNSLARGVRRAVEQLPTAQVPVAVRPFSTFKPEALRGASHARRALADALVRDVRFRVAVGEAVADDAARAGASQVDPLTLRAEVGPDQAVALLAVTGQWDALATLAAALADERAARGVAAAEVAPDPPREDTVGELREEVRALQRTVQDAQRREAELRRSIQRLVAERDAAQAAATDARSEQQDLADVLDAERAEHRERLARARRKADEARQWAAASDERTSQVLAELADLATRLQEPLHVDHQDPLSEAGGSEDAEGAEDLVSVPRQVRPATPGRPNRLPPGVDPEGATAVLSLLQVPGLRVFIDGYNVTKDVRGVPALPLEQQRRWLVRMVNGVVARFDVRPTLVFDGRADTGGEVPRARGVIVCFTMDETADDMLVEMLDGLEADAPALVVSSDREIRDAAAVRGVNSVASDRFIAAVVG